MGPLQASVHFLPLWWYVFLIVDKIEITETGKKSSLFRSILRSFVVKYEHNNVVIEAEQNDTLSKITENFFILPILTRFRLSIGFRLFHVEGFNRPFSASL
jgi:hypothetical protein